MLVGNKARFAIEADPQTIEGEWILGGFRFWLCGCEVGNWSECTALQYCFAGLRAFSRDSVARAEPSIAHIEGREIFELVVGPVMAPKGIADPQRQPIPFSYERFHLTHLGMSSFDDFVIVLVKDADGAERCLCRRLGEDEILDCWLAPGEMEQVAERFCDLFEAKYMKGSMDQQ